VKAADETDAGAQRSHQTARRSAVSAAAHAKRHIGMPTRKTKVSYALIAITPTVRGGQPNLTFAGSATLGSHADGQPFT